MGHRLFVLSAGTGASNNLISSLRAGDSSHFIVGGHHDRFFLKKSSADRNYLISHTAHPSFAESLRHVIKTEEIDLLMPTSDRDVTALSTLRDELPCRLFLPRRDVIELCQDKYSLAVFLRERGLPAPATDTVTDLESLDTVFRRLPPGPRYWCRIRTGTDSIGAIPVKSPDQARAWISYWEEMRGFPAASFTVSEYLPGRAFSSQSIWKDGSLVLVKTFEHLSYFRAEARPSGVSSVTALAKTVFEPRVVEVAVEALRALDPTISGAFDVDLKDDADGAALITEINAGRFLSGTTLFDLTGKHNMAAAYVRLALDEPVDISEAYDVSENYYMVRDLDTLPMVLHADQLYDGINDARPRNGDRQT